MKFSHVAIRFAAAALASFVLSGVLPAQGLEPDTLLNPPADSWPGYHGDYSGRRHSPLTQITPENVQFLGLAWAFQTGTGGTLKSSPLLVDGVLYFTLPDNVWAVDARSGHQIWHYTYPANKGFHIGQRGVAMYHDWLYFMAPDAHLISLNAKDGTVRWNVVVADAKKGYWTTMSPLVVRNHVIVGVSGDFDNLRGYLRSIDPETGKTQWQWDSTPPVGTPNATTGGMTWMTGTYDPGPEPALLGHGQSDPSLDGHAAPRRQPLHLQHRGPESGHRQTGLGLPAFAARHPRLGRSRNSGAGGRRLRRQAAKDADADLAQRLLLCAGSNRRQEPPDHHLWPGELVAWASTSKAARSRIRQKSRLATDG